MRALNFKGVEMKVKDVLVSALGFAGREDVAEALERGDAPEGGIAEALKTALYCFNAVEDELARRYVSITRTDELTSGDGIYYYKDFPRAPVKIVSVKSDGADAAYKLTPTYMECEKKKIKVTYGYVPSKKGVDGEGEFSEGIIPLRLIAAGTASEFCLINGETGRAEIWQNVYREEIDKVRRSALIEMKLPPRRWV